MQDVVEIRWHARAGQGAVTAAKMLAQAALREGKYSQAFPEYGPERSGAPLRAYNRISARPIRVHSQVVSPDVVVVVDGALVESEDPSAGGKPTTIFVVNGSEPARTIGRHLAPGGQAVYALDASEIAMEEFGKNFPNTPMLGALAGATGVVNLDGLLAEVGNELGRKVSATALRANLRAVRRGHAEVRRVSLPAREAATTRETPPPLAAWQELATGALVLRAGNAGQYVTGAWRRLRPVLNERCNHCLLCWFFCPDSAVLVKNGKLVGFDLDHCKGCGICAAVCPPRLRAIEMVEESACREKRL